MGAEISSIQGPGRELLERIAGADAIPFEDPLWGQVWQHKLVVPRKGTADATDKASLAWARALIANTASCNFKTLLRHLIHRLARCISGDAAALVGRGTDATDLPAALGLLFLVRSATKHMVEILDSHKLAEMLGAGEGKWGGDGRGEGASLMEALCDALALILQSEQHADHTHGTYTLHCESARLFLILFGTQLTQPLSDSAYNPCLAYMMARTDDARRLTAALLRHYITHPPPPPVPAVTAGSLLGVALTSTVGVLPAELLHFGSGFEEKSASPLADVCALVMLVVVSYSQKDAPNPYKEEIASFSELQRSLDELDAPEAANRRTQSDKALGKGAGGGADRHAVVENESGLCVAFEGLYEAIAESLVDDRTVLILYLMIYTNHKFLNFILAKSEPDGLLVPLLKLLYSSQQVQPNNKYMILIVLLILSHDALYCANIHTVSVPHVIWFKERMIGEISVGSLVVIVLVWTMQMNLRIQDVFLNSNCLAILMNLAPHLSNIHPYAAQKLVSLFEVLSRRFDLLVQRREKGGEGGGGEEDGDETDGERLRVYGDLLRTCLEVVNAAVTYSLPRNLNLVYSLVHRKESFARKYDESTGLQELIDNINTVIHFFSKKVDKCMQPSEPCSPEIVMQHIKDASMSWGAHLRMFPELRFNYEQDEKPEEFFTPYMWGIVLAHSHIHWDAQKLRLFIQ